jgi:hypothetical protein
VSTLHDALGIATLALAVLVLCTTLGSAVLGDRLPRAARRWAVDGLALAVEASVLVTGLVGPVLLATGHQPADLLHFLYAAVALGALPVTLGIAMSRGAAGARRDRWLALGALILVGVSIRLLQTG